MIGLLIGALIAFGLLYTLSWNAGDISREEEKEDEI